jgi:hypothetical protein
MLMVGCPSCGQAIETFRGPVATPGQVAFCGRCTEPMLLLDVGARRLSAAEITELEEASERFASTRRLLRAAREGA